MAWFDYLAIRLHGLEFRNDLFQGQVPFDDSRVQEVFTTWQPLLEKGYFTEKFFSTRLSQASMSVLDGEAAMTLTSARFILTIVPETRWGELDVFRFPILDPALPVGERVSLEGLVIPATLCRVARRSGLRRLSRVRTSPDPLGPAAWGCGRSAGPERHHARCIQPGPTESSDHHPGCGRVRPVYVLDVARLARCRLDGC